MERIEYAKTGGGCPKFVIYEYDEHGREEFKERDLRPDENLESTRYDPLPILTGRVTLELPRRSKRPKRYLMAYPGNLKGPRESELIQKLGHEYFGITPGRPYILLSGTRLGLTKATSQPRSNYQGEGCGELVVCQISTGV